MDNPGLLTFCLCLTVMVMGTTQGVEIYKSSPRISPVLREEWE